MRSSATFFLVFVEDLKFYKTFQNKKDFKDILSRYGYTIGVKVVPHTYDFDLLIFSSLIMEPVPFSNGFPKSHSQEWLFAWFLSVTGFLQSRFGNRLCMGFSASGFVMVFSASGFVWAFRQAA